jgi:glycosyltransferase involved in cell wall biosynthesis
MAIFKKIASKKYDVCIIHLADARFYPFFHRQAAALAEKNFSVALVSWEGRRGEGDVEWPGIDVYPIFIPGKTINGKLFFVRYFFSLLFVLLRLRARLYEAVDPPTLIPARIAAFFHGSRYNYFSLEFFQGVDQVVSRPVVRWVWYLLERIGIRHAQNVAAVCETTERFLKEEYRLTSTATVLNVPSIAEYAGTGDGRLRRRLGLQPGIPLVVYKGEIADNRGLLPFVKALQPFDAVHFACIGSGAFRKAIERAAGDAGCAGRVHFCDPVPSNEFVHYLKDADLGQVIHEGRGVNMMVTLPSKLFDYLHAGIPVIASDGPEISRIVRQWNVGWVVSPSSIESIQKAISEFLAAFPGHDDMKKNCAAAAEQFSWEKEKFRYISYIEKAFEKK